jgi:hypothetical protein
VKLKAKAKEQYFKSKFFFLSDPENFWKALQFFKASFVKKADENHKKNKTLFPVSLPVLGFYTRRLRILYKSKALNRYKPDHTI